MTSNSQAPLIVKEIKYPPTLKKDFITTLITDDLKNKGYKTKFINQTEFLVKKIYMFKVILNFSGNSIKIKVYRQVTLKLPKLFDKEIFRLKVGHWLVAFFLIIISLLLFLILKEHAVVLIVVGALWIALSLISILLYELSVVISSIFKESIINNAHLLSNLITMLIEEKDERAVKSRYCWNCYKKINKKTDKCPNCGASIRQQ